MKTLTSNQIIQLKHLIEYARDKLVSPISNKKLKNKSEAIKRLTQISEYDRFLSDSGQALKNLRLIESDFDLTDFEYGVKCVVQDSKSKTFAEVCGTKIK